MSNDLIPVEIIESWIYHIRGQKVMLDNDLATLYEVETRRLNEAVKRNIKRFPEEFMFQLTREEFEILKSQFATSSWGGRRKLPSAFTEHGVVMLSSVLNSERAIAVNIQIIKTFNRLKKLIVAHKDLSKRLDELEAKYDKQFAVVFDALRQLLETPEESKKSVGFRVGSD